MLSVRNRKSRKWPGGNVKIRQKDQKVTQNKKSLNNNLLISSSERDSENQQDMELFLPVERVGFSFQSE
jgi:hypothetical protein